MTNNPLKLLLEQNSFLIDFLNNVSDSIYIVDKAGRFVFINKSVELVEGFQNKDVAGKTVQEVYQFPETPLLQVLNSFEPVKEFSYSYTVNGKEVFQSCRAFPITLSNQVIGAYAIQRDITSLKEIIEENLSLHEKLVPFTNQHLAPKASSIFNRLIGKHPLFIECINNATSAAKNDSSILLTGSTGSGKEVFAKCIHDASSRRPKPFLAINCAAIPETLLESILFGTSKGAYTGAVERIGLFEQANGGTLFLDEINSMPLMAQAKLLRVLEEKKVRHLGSQNEISVDVRIISSSNVMAQQAIDEHQLREDLFYRLSVINIIIPDLASRRSDIFLLVDHFIKEYNTKFNRHITGITRDVQDFFLQYAWPGNVRQLRHCIEAAMNFVDDHELTISIRHLPKYLFSDTKLTAMMESQANQQISDENSLSDEVNVFDTIDQEEKKEITNALRQCKGNVTKSAEYLGITRQALIYRMRKYNITKK